MSAERPAAAADPTPRADPARDVRTAIAANVRRTRRASGLSLRELASRSGVSAGLLSQIERGVGNPAIDILSRIATALDASFAELTRFTDFAPVVERIADAETTINTVTGLTLRELFESPDPTRFEVRTAYFAAGAYSRSGPHGVGSREFAFVTRGTVTVTVGDWREVLREGDSITFAAQRDHEYVNDGPDAADVLTLVLHADREFGAAH